MPHHGPVRRSVPLRADLSLSPDFPAPNARRRTQPGSRATYAVAQAAPRRQGAADAAEGRLACMHRSVTTRHWPHSWGRAFRTTASAGRSPKPTAASRGTGRPACWARSGWLTGACTGRWASMR
ncbi:hypothetical protein CBM2587_B20102 [Cupriavidus taiwanensis]|uniref:Uncharacterized protein n=1 Tax=Cupriavidus taiwanensis TaxID=164546 RepID=A0A375C1Y4_9BURK|nr:hypothetical protein CBM2587_B20102 [Cupriavidus taiwanensis]